MPPQTHPRDRLQFGGVGGWRAVAGLALMSGCSSVNPDFDGAGSSVGPTVATTFSTESPPFETNTTRDGTAEDPDSEGGSRTGTSTRGNGSATDTDGPQTSSATDPGDTGNGATPCCEAAPGEGMPGCDDPCMETCVCEFDPSCCTMTWDRLCATVAALDCTQLCNTECD